MKKLNNFKKKLFASNDIKWKALSRIQRNMQGL